MTEQRTARQWIIRINGAEQARVKPGEDVEIGRKPLRPLNDDGFRRIEIADDTRSMSKRHALFAVSDRGVASLRDLNSTNGTYVVRPNGDLARLPGGSDIPISEATAHVQFGDVPVDFIPQEEPAGNAAPEVADLFGHAPNENRQEPDPADLSVDQILDLRAGEPTSVFDAQNIRSHIRGVHVPDLPHIPGLTEHETEASKDEDSSDAAQLKTRKRDPRPEVSAAVAENTPDGRIEPVIAAPEERPEGRKVAPEAADSRSRLREVSVELPERQQSSAVSVVRAAEPKRDAAGEISLNVVQPARPAEPLPRDLFADARANGAGASAETAHEQIAPATQSEKVRLAGGQEPVVRRGEEPQPKPQQAQPSAAAVESRTPDARQQLGIGQHGTGEASPEHAAYAPLGGSGDVDPDTTAAFKPVFEPGSVFERVSKGELRQNEERIEIDGLNSDEARRVTDFTVQFEIARHAELLPFLAMNPSLYDDLYAWLSAQGSQDIDAALSRNSGYAEYRAHIGK